MTSDTGLEGITGRQGQEVHIPFRWYHQHIAMQEGSPVLAVLFIFTEMLEIQLLCEISHLFFFILETSPLSFFFFLNRIFYKPSKMISACQMWPVGSQFVIANFSPTPSLEIKRGN